MEEIIKCPECGDFTDVDTDELELGTPIECEHCSEELEVTNLQPLEVDYASDEDEDDEECDDMDDDFDLDDEGEEEDEESIV